jgi:hypothetical protein
MQTEARRKIKNQKSKIDGCRRAALPLQEPGN